MRALVTGATGFAGSHLVDHLTSNGHVVFGLVFEGEQRPPYMSKHALFHPVEGDILDVARLKETVSGVKPDVIFHLAGWAQTAKSWEAPARTIAVNTGGTANVLEAALTGGRPPVIAITSAEIYGAVGSEHLPITEETRPSPHHPYGVSKWAAGRLARLYWDRYRLPVIEVRPFNHIGPRQALGFVVPDFASQLAAIKLGWREPSMSVGNLSTERDFTDVRDVVRAYTLLAEQGEPGSTYIVCSGEPTPISFLLHTLIEIADVPVEITQDPDRMRPSETPTLYGSFARLQGDTGWSPEIPIKRSLGDTFSDWIDRQRNEHLAQQRTS